jgi:hypothetical protein
MRGVRGCYKYFVPTGLNTFGSLHRSLFHLVGRYRRLIRLYLPVTHGLAAGLYLSINC